MIGKAVHGPNMDVNKDTDHKNDFTHILHSTNMLSANRFSKRPGTKKSMFEANKFHFNTLQAKLNICSVIRENGPRFHLTAVWFDVLRTFSVSTWNYSITCWTWRLTHTNESCYAENLSECCYLMCVYTQDYTSTHYYYSMDCYKMVFALFGRIKPFFQIRSVHRESVDNFLVNCYIFISRYRVLFCFSPIFVLLVFHQNSHTNCGAMAHIVSELFSLSVAKQFQSDAKHEHEVEYRCMCRCFGILDEKRKSKRERKGRTIGFLPHFPSRRTVFIQLNQAFVMFLALSFCLCFIDKCVSSVCFVVYFRLHASVIRFTRGKCISLPAFFTSDFSFPLCVCVYVVWARSFLLICSILVGCTI